MTLHVASFLAAAAPSITEQLKRVPKETWINIVICIAAIFAMVSLWRTLKKINEFVPYIAAVLGSALIFFYWVYERTEPRFLTPIVERLAPFFPSKSKQDQIQEKRRQGRDV